MGVKMKKLNGAQLVKLRRDLGLNQTEFWRAVDVTQSGGSRYESGRKLPKAVARLVGIVYYGMSVPRWNWRTSRFL